MTFNTPASGPRRLLAYRARPLEGRPTNNQLLKTREQAPRDDVLLWECWRYRSPYSRLEKNGTSRDCLFPTLIPSRFAILLVMRGTLGLFNLLELLQLLNSSGRTGALLVNHPRYGESRLYFVKGRIVHAAQRNVFDEGVIYNLLRDERGDFDFQAGRTAPEESIALGFDALMFAVLKMLPTQAQDHSEGKDTLERGGLGLKLRLQVGPQLSGHRVALNVSLLERWELALDRKVKRVRLRLEGSEAIILSVQDDPKLDTKTLLISSEALLYHGLSAGQSVRVRPETEGKPAKK